MSEKRPYTMSDEALAQRQAAAQKSTGPKTEAGKAAVSRNAWKTGEHSVVNKYHREKLIARTGKPCKTTCPKHPEQNPEYPCSLVLEEKTQAGGDCLDKEEFLMAFDNLMDAMSTGQAEHVHGLMAMHLTDALMLLQEIRAGISENGVLMQREIYDKEGNVAGYQDYTNPLIETYSKHLKALGLNLGEALATPKAIRTTEQKEDENETFAQLFGGIASRLGKSAPKDISGTAEVVHDE